MYLIFISFCSQDVVLMRALRDMNLPKFVFEDVPLFLGLIADLFPGLDCPRVRYPNFNDAVEAVLVDNKYVLLPHQVTRAHPETYVSVKQG
jgi:dynein heavy chain